MSSVSGPSSSSSGSSGGSLSASSGASLGGGGTVPGFNSSASVTALPGFDGTNSTGLGGFDERRRLSLLA